MNFSLLCRKASGLIAIGFLFVGPSVHGEEASERVSESSVGRLVERLQQREKVLHAGPDDPEPSGLREHWRDRRGGQTRGSQEASGGGLYSLDIEHDGLKREFLVYVPRAYRPHRPTPLVVALHGGGGSARYMAHERYGLVDKAEKEGTVIAFPNGFSRFPSGIIATWNAGTCCGAARDRQIDDVGFVRRMLDELQARLNIDRTRIFATGMSNGGLMAYRLACELPEVFRAIASVAGTDNTVSCTPAQPVSVLHIHARDDDHVLYDGGAGPSAFRDRDAVTDFRSVPATVARWVGFNGCSTTPERVLQQPGAVCEQYSGCTGNARVKLCTTESGGHSWPGGEKRRANRQPPSSLSANDLMWDFFLNASAE